VGRNVRRLPAGAVPEDGNLDSQTSSTIIDLLRGLSRSEGTTVIVVTHDATIAGQADRMLQLEDGRLLPATQAAGEDVR